MSTPATISLSVLFNGDRILALPPLAPTIDVATIKMIVGSETNVSAASIVLLYKQLVLTDGQTLAGVGVADHEMLEARASSGRPAAPQALGQAQRAQAPQAQSSAGRSTNSLGIPDSILRDPVAARAFIRDNMQLLYSIESQNPQLYQAIMSDGVEPFRTMWSRILENIDAEKAAETARFRLANADPMDPEVQARIAEEIRLKNVQENYEMAVEHNPEAFGRVIMLYVNMSVNGTKVQAFVDSGAQSTIMNIQCAERCGIMRLIDRRFAGMAKGVGQAKILGRVHQIPCTIGGAHCSMSFTILDNPDMDFLLGLDQLKNHQACIDLSKNALCILGQEIPFLSEKDLPGHAKDQAEVDEDMPSTSSGSSTQAGSRPAAPPAAAAAGASRPAAASTPTPAARPAPAAASPAASGPSPAAAAAVAAAQRRADAANTNSGAPAAAATAVRPPVSVNPPPAATPARPAAPAAAAYTPSAEHIAQLTDLGFSRVESVAALTRFGGNVDAAASFLFSS